MGGAGAGRLWVGLALGIVGLGVKLLRILEDTIRSLICIMRSEDRERVRMDASRAYQNLNLY